MRKILIKFLNYLIFKEFPQEYARMDKRAVEEWLYESYKNPGAMDYLKVEELKILKNMARGLPENLYWKEIGKREQLSFILNDFQKVFELRKAADAKAEAENKKKGGDTNENSSNSNPTT